MRNQRQGAESGKRWYVRSEKRDKTWTFLSRDIQETFARDLVCAGERVRVFKSVTYGYRKG